jgi:hypothetical protein
MVFEVMPKPLKEAAWRPILPEIRQIVKEEIHSAMGQINAKFEAVNRKIDSTREELILKNESLNMKLDSLRNELKSNIESVHFSVRELDKRMDVVQRLAVIEAKLREQEKKS